MGWLTEHPFLTLAGALGVAYGLMGLFRERLLGFREVGPQEAVRLINDGALVLDVRRLEERRAARLAGSRRLPLDELGGRLEELAPWRGRPVLVACRSGQRAARAGALLRRAGFTRIHKLSGGLLAWEGAGLPLRRSGPPEGEPSEEEA